MRTKKPRVVVDRVEEQPANSSSTYMSFLEPTDSSIRLWFKNPPKESEKVIELCILKNI